MACICLSSFTNEPPSHQEQRQLTAGTHLVCQPQLHDNPWPQLVAVFLYPPMSWKRNWSHAERTHYDQLNDRMVAESLCSVLSQTTTHIYNTINASSCLQTMAPLNFSPCTTIILLDHKLGSHTPPDTSEHSLPVIFYK